MWTVQNYTLRIESFKTKREALDYVSSHSNHDWVVVCRGGVEKFNGEVENVVQQMEKRGR